MTAAQVVQELRAAGVHVEVKGLRISTTGSVPAPLANRILENRDPILEFLRAESEKLSRARWCTIRSRLLDWETFLLVIAEEHLEAAKKAHPDKVVYLLDELLPIIDAGISDEELKAIHVIKKRFRGKAEVLRGETGNLSG